MKQISFLTLMTALSLTACDSKEEQAREKALENRADSLENQAKATEKVGEAKADAEKRAAEAQAERS